MRPRLLTIPQVAAKLNKGTLTINRYVHDGRLPAERYGYMFLIEPEDVDKFLASGGFKPAGRPKKKVVEK